MNYANTTAQPESGERAYYNVSEAAALLGVSRMSLWRWIRAGHLPAARLGHRTVRIERGDLEELLTKGRAVGFHAKRDRQADAEPVGPGAHADERASQVELGRCEHFVQFYETDAFLASSVADFIGAALDAGEAGIVVATPAHREAIERRLAADGLDLAAARAAGRFVSLDAATTLATFMAEGLPDARRFRSVIGSLIQRIAAGGRHVRVFGEMVALLALEGNHLAAIRLEALWNDLQTTQAFALFCAYPMAKLRGGALAELVGNVCAEHSRVVPAESYATLPTPDERLRAIAVLQQKAESLAAEIAERERAEERLRAALAAEQAARTAAEEALRFRDEFLSIAAHELKTPLAAILGQAQLVLRRFNLEAEVEPERLRRSLETIARQSDRVARLLAHLFDVSRIQAGKLTIDRKPTNLSALIEQTVAAARAQSDRHVITLEAPRSTEVWIDPLRFEQVLTNLLDNAIKYSPVGGPIEIVLAPRADAQVELTVRDRGLGIPPERRGQIFDRFYQAHGDSHVSGLGLGLYISRQIVEQHGGEIRAEFPADGGTRFIVRLPTERAEAAGDPSEAVNPAVA
ncbi:MAG: MEDS domain-containing protein [Chloroflexi bacterium]|nr:MEDS domain-containing protein [Chloroflexota bacterium]